ncbi:hypothetical protein KAFR_0G03120 [Kazachstania africana CBS 2517]|uniref:1-acyl-sn-glycerol-3-phosphate acyltransferase n=1 Tax=Kazachstania africana (strain ATCC 22294 / BCRC 22015 / CBS 2517 / CECT 1963 / NBRC 1671 / NRRL Y-8276) TaxID=1071382 RepID=H2AY94_KAZAF|nr:hypothetical protein KAFR_0G03120 [Kazachstania africana CBS 2517]CCF59344.1 hypothetical protein KAFR_0G03120 [Kazachstania africana CBS 2517]
MANNFLYYFRTFLAVVVLMVSALYGTLASIVCLIIGKQHLAQWTTARFYYYASKYIMGIDVKVINEHNITNLPCIAVSNHQSALDILVLGRMFPKGCTVSAKKSLRYVPILGWFMALSGTLFLDRGNREKSVKTLNNSLRKIKDNKRALWIFPEGTRSYTTDLETLPFKKGAFHLAQQGNIPIVPVVVSNTSTIMFSKWNVFNRGTLIIKVLDPIPTSDLKKEDIGAFTEKVRDLISKELKEVGYSIPIVDTNLPPNLVEKNGRIVKKALPAKDIVEEVPASSSIGITAEK